MGKKSHGGTSRRRDRPPRTNSTSSDDGLGKFAHDYSKDYQDPNWPYAKGKMDKFGWFLIIATPVIIGLAIGYFWYADMLKNKVRTPLDAPLMISPNASTAAENPDRFWGSYRSGVYFGLKTRSPNSPVVGLMWMTQMTGEMPPPLRHWCEQGDGLLMYSWFVHDGANFGHQEIIDKFYTLSTDFVKRPGGQHGGEWSARINVKPRPGAESAVMSLFFYMALDGDGHIEPHVNKNRLQHITGYSQELGNFRLVFPKASTNLRKSNHLVTYAESLHQLKETLMAGSRMSSWGKDNLQYIGLGGRVMPRDKAGFAPNFIVHQVTVNLPYTLEVIFESGSVMSPPEPLSGDFYQNTINQYLVNFDKKFEEIFGLQQKGFDSDKISYAKAALSNMLGSIGYFYGHSLVRSKYTTKDPLKYWDAPLYTGVPSRSFFPRGFLWDEGFHNLLISRWDMDISKDIIGHWLDLMNIEGWIPREQILGLEARAKVPDEFVVQHNEIANPPTLFLPLQRIVKQLINSDRAQDRLYLQHLFPRLKTWFNWFNTTQPGSKPFTYRWKGRDATSIRELNPKTLSSGLDDFPRASHPTDDERHVDLRCWMALASGILSDIAKSLGEPSQEYETTHELLTDNTLLDELHWSEKGQMYADYGFHSNHVKLERPKPKNIQPGQRPPPPQEKERVVKQPPQHQYVDSFGYVSLFPFLLRIVEPDSLKLGKILSDLKDPNLLWTKFGLRSLAKSAPLYNKHNTEHDPAYWRGAIWINMNYLAVGALHHYSTTQGPHQASASELYTELRHNLINNIISQYKTTGFIWENYDDVTGKGKGCHPFTGWSALVVLIMAEEY